MEQPGYVMLRIEKVIEAHTAYEEHEATKREGRRGLKHGSEGL